MRTFLLRTAVAFGIALAGSPAAAQGPPAEECGGCPEGDMWGACLLGCPVGNPGNCGLCWDGDENTMCMMWSGGCDEFATAFDGTTSPSIATEGAIDKMGAITVRFVSLSSGHRAELWLKQCNGMILGRSYPREYVLQRIADDRRITM